MEVVHEVCCGLDVHKKSVTACVLWASGRRKQIREFGTSVNSNRSRVKHGHRRLDLAGDMREPRKFDVGACCHAQPGNEHSCGPRSEPLGTRPPSVDRKSDGIFHRSATGTYICLLGKPLAGGSHDPGIPYSGPAWRCSREDPASVLQQNARSLAGGIGRLSKALIITQVALSLIMLLGAGLLLRTFERLRAVDLGFEKESVLEMSLYPMPGGYQNLEMNNYHRQLIERISKISGVSADRPPIPPPWPPSRVRPADAAPDGRP